MKVKYSEMDLKKKGIRLLLLNPTDGERWFDKYLALRERYLLH